MASNHSALLEGPILRSLMRLAIPTLSANLLQTGYQITDAFWVGRLGAASIAAVSLSTPLVFFIIAIGGGLGVAGSTLVAQNHGARNRAVVDHVAGQTLLLMTGLSVVLSSLGILLAPEILKLIGVAPDVYHAALGFLRMSFGAAIFVFGFIVFQALMRGVGEVMIPLFITGGTVLLNFALDPLFIFGWHGFPPLGVMGAALATLGTQAVAMAIAVTILVRGRHGISLRVRSLWPDPAFARRVFALGFPSSVELSARGIGLMLLAFLVARFGTVTLAAFGVGGNILQFVVIPAIGLASASAALIGQNIGAGNIERAGRVAVTGAIVSFCLLAALGLLAYVAAPDLAAFFVPNDRGVIAQAAAFIRIMCLSWGFVGMQYCFIAAFRASGKMWTAMVFGLFWQCGLQFPLAYLLAVRFSMGAGGLWWSFPLTNVVIALMSYAWFARGGWRTGSLATRPATAG